MDLAIAPRLIEHMLFNTMLGADGGESSVCPFIRKASHSCPYMRRANQSVMHVGNDTQPVVDDDKKFAVSLDVSQFRPDDLNVHLEGRVLTVEGNQEQKTENSMMQRSFVRKWVLPENVNLEAVRTALDENGHLCVEAPKSGAEEHQKRNIPITAAPKSKQ